MTADADPAALADTQIMLPVLKPATPEPADREPGLRVILALPHGPRPDLH